MRAEHSWTLFKLKYRIPDVQTHTDIWGAATDTGRKSNLSAYTSASLDQQAWGDWLYELGSSSYI